MFFFAAGFVLAQQSGDGDAEQNDTPQTESIGAPEENNPVAAPAASLVVSERLAAKMRELEKTAAEIEGQDNAALEKIGGKIDGTIALLPLNADLVAAVKDKRFDWRVRCLLMFYKSYTAGESKLTKYSSDFIGIMRDKTEHEKVRGMAALMLVDISAKTPVSTRPLKKWQRPPTHQVKFSKRLWCLWAMPA